MRRLVLLIVLATAPLGTVASGPLPMTQASTVPARPGNWVWPVPSEHVVHAFDLPAEPWLPGHRGVDLAAGRDSTVRSAGRGTVVFAGSVAGVPVVTVEHEGGLRTTYQPVRAAVRAGDRVAAGDRIGTLVRSGSHCDPAACLHWGLLRGTDYLDPLLLVLPATLRLLPFGDDGAGSVTP